MDTFVGAFGFMRDRLPLLLEKTGQHVVMCALVIGISLVVAVPVGLWLGHLHRGEFLTTSIANIGRALPNLAVIAIGLGIIGLNFTNIAVALLITAVPPILSQAYLAVDQVDPDLVRAARGMGLTPYQVLRKVELPLSLPLLFSGVRIAVSHRVGDLAVGDVAIVCAVSSAHRDRAYSVNRDVVERVKAELPVWKKQVEEGGSSSWIGLGGLV